MTKRKWTSKDLKDIESLRKQKFKWEYIATIYNVTPRTIRGIRYNLKRMEKRAVIRQALWAEKADKIKNIETLIEEGKGYKEIAPILKFVSAKACNTFYNRYSFLTDN